MREDEVTLRKRAMYGKLSNEEWEAMADELRQVPRTQNFSEYLDLFGYADTLKYKPLLTQFLEGDDRDAQMIVAINLFALVNDIHEYMNSAIKVLRQIPYEEWDELNHTKTVIISASKKYLAEQWDTRLVLTLLHVAENPRDAVKAREQAAVAMATAVGLAGLRPSLGSEEFIRVVEATRARLRKERPLQVRDESPLLYITSRAMSGKVLDDEWEILADEVRRNPHGKYVYEYLHAFGYSDLEKYRDLLTQFLLSEDMEARSLVAGKLFALQNAMELFIQPAIKIIEALPEKAYSYYDRSNLSGRDVETYMHEMSYIIHFNGSRRITIEAAGEYLAEHSEPGVLAALIKVVENSDDDEALRGTALNALAFSLGMERGENGPWYSLRDEEYQQIMPAAKARLRQEEGKANER